MNWISVKNRLPEECLNVLVFIQDANKIGIAIAYYFDDNWWGWISDFKSEPGIEIFDDNYRGFTRSKNVTHWMPLPELPKK